MVSLRKPPERKFNTKRSILSLDEYLEQKTFLQNNCKNLGYDGKAEHKKNPGDFNLTPPACGRMDKTLCDISGVFTHRRAIKLLREGYGKGLIDRRVDRGWPRHIWTVVDESLVLEAKPSLAGSGIYHGYPLPESDPLREKILLLWKTR